MNDNMIREIGSLAAKETANKLHFIPENHSVALPRISSFKTSSGEYYSAAAADARAGYEYETRRPA